MAEREKQHTAYERPSPNEFTWVSIRCGNVLPHNAMTAEFRCSPAGSLSKFRKRECALVRKQVRIP